MNIKQKITSALAVGTMMASVVAPSAFAANSNTVTVTGGGAFSSSKVVVKNKTTKTVNQSNATVVQTNVGQSAKTGGNSSSFNTGGTNGITTGNATNTAVVSVTGGTNTNSSDCGCEGGGNTNNVSVTGGGAFSYTMAVVKNSSTTTVNQGNSTVVGTSVWQSSSTGHNSSSFNTGGGNTIETGDASNTVGVEVGGNTNTN